MSPQQRAVPGPPPDWDAWPGLLLQTDGMGRVSAANAALRALAGWTDSLPAGHTLDELLPPPSRILVQTHVWPLLIAQQAVREFHLVLRPPGGASFPALLEARYVLQREGHATVQWLFMPAHERSRFEAALVDARTQLAEQARTLRELNASLEAKVADRTAELVRAKEAAEAASHDKSVFLTNISHELRSPLHGILGFARLLIDDLGIEADRRVSFLRKVERNGSNLLALVNDLLDSARIETQEFTLDVEACDLAHIARQVVEELQGGAMVGSPVQLGLPLRAPCVGDPLRLAQVVRNLLANALRFSPKGSPIDVSIAAEGEGWMVVVQDRGPGIPEGELEVIFQRFSQSSRTRTGAGGTGLGLPIARGIVHQHGGWIRAEHRDGGGAIFRCFIPVGAPA